MSKKDPETTPVPDETTTTQPPPSTITEGEAALLAPGEKPLSPRAQLLLNRIKAPNAPKGDKIVTHNVQIVSVPIGDLKAAIESNPSHPVAAIYANAIANLPGGYIVSVEQPDLQALLENREVVIDEHDGPSGRVHTKRIV